MCVTLDIGEAEQIRVVLSTEKEAESWEEIWLLWCPIFNHPYFRKEKK